MTIIDMFRARKRIAPYVRRTPLVASQWLSEIAGGRVALKLESLQLSNSFKARGAFNAVIARRERGELTATRLVTASAGNHGRALAAAAETFRVPLVVFTPVDAPQAKLSAIRHHGAELRAEGRNYEEAERLAKRFAKETGADYVSPYSDSDVIAGAATIALEILEEAPATGTFMVPVGGGGLIAGVAEVAKSISADTRVIGIEAAASCPFQTSLRAGRLVKVEVGATLADGLSGNPDSDTITFAPIQRLVDQIVSVSEGDLARAIVGLAEYEHLIVEGAGAAAVAAVIAHGGHRLDPSIGLPSPISLDRPGRHVAVIITGGNIDREQLQELLVSSPARSAR